MHEIEIGIIFRAYNDIMLCFLVPCFNLNGVVLDTNCEDPAVRLELVGIM